MTQTAASTYVYVTYIRTTVERLWTVLTTPELLRPSWYDMTLETDWKAGSPWLLRFPDGRVADTGEVLEIDPPRRLVLSWRNEFMPELKAEGFARCTLELEAVAGAVKLTVIHTMDRAGSLFIEKVAGGWPRILSNLKSYLETGEVLLKP
jgi:uncharacterized protein YndB with AHSA1/START domain